MEINIFNSLYQSTATSKYYHKREQHRTTLYVRILSSVVTHSPGPFESAQRTDSSSPTTVADSTRPAEKKTGGLQMNQQLSNDKVAQLRAERDRIEQELRDKNRLIEEAKREKSV